MDPALAAQYEHDLEVRVCFSGDALRAARGPASLSLECRPLRPISPSRSPRPRLSRMRTTTCERGKLEPSVRSLVL